MERIGVYFRKWSLFTIVVFKNKFHTCSWEVWASFLKHTTLQRGVSTKKLCLGMTILIRQKYIEAGESFPTVNLTEENIDLKILWEEGDSFSECPWVRPVSFRFTASTLNVANNWLLRAPNYWARFCVMSQKSAWGLSSEFSKALLRILFSSRLWTSATLLFEVMTFLLVSYFYHIL